MHKLTRKIYISILTFVFLLFTVVATTYSWVGILTYSSIEDFNLNIKTSKTKDYSLLISGFDEVYGEYVSKTTIQKNILANMYGFDNVKNVVESSDESYINYNFNRMAGLAPVTTYVNSDLLLDTFYEMPNLANGNTNFEKSNKYFKFDLFFIIDPINDSNNKDTFIDSNLLISNLTESMVGTKSTGTLISGNPFISNPSTKYEILNSIPNAFTIDSSYASRLAIQIFEPIEIESSYEQNQLPTNTYIFYNGTIEPSCNENIYNLGGILPEENNFAIQQINKIYNVDLKIDNKYKDRMEYSTQIGEKYIRKKNDNSKSYFGIKNGIKTKIKISVYFWFEGWDADCIEFIDMKKVLINLNFAIDSNEN